MMRQCIFVASRAVVAGIDGFPARCVHTVVHARDARVLQAQNAHEFGARGITDSNDVVRASVASAEDQLVSESKAVDGAEVLIVTVEGDEIVARYHAFAPRPLHGERGGTGVAKVNKLCTSMPHSGPKSDATAICPAVPIYSPWLWGPWVASYLAEVIGEDGI